MMEDCLRPPAPGQTRVYVVLTQAGEAATRFRVRSERGIDTVDYRDGRQLVSEQPRRWSLGNELLSAMRDLVFCGADEPAMYARWRDWARVLGDVAEPVDECLEPIWRDAKARGLLELIDYAAWRRRPLPFPPEG
jgi:hypothetical protein